MGYHVQPARGWLNDPNGLVFRDGRWHVFFQHNPASARHADIAWGHVSSSDLVAWRDHPVAFAPSQGRPDAGGCWSGVCVDLGERVAAVYTGIRTKAVDSTVCLRYAFDAALEAWSEPVVVASVPDLGLGRSPISEMRDPFVFTWAGRRWALVGAGLADRTPALLLWSCDDLEAWRFERVWVTGADLVLRTLAPAEVWECPQLMEVDGSWVLVVSLWRNQRLEGTVAAVGSIDRDRGGLPRLVLRGGGRVDEGRAFYAPQIALDDRGPWMLGWVMEVSAADDAPSDAVAGCLTLPRRLRVEADRLLCAVDPAVRSLVGGEVAVDAGGRLPAYGHLVAQDAVTLIGKSQTVPVPAGSEVWLDDEVVEVYPVDAPPQTHRDPSTSRWRLDGPLESVVIRWVAVPGRPGDTHLSGDYAVLPRRRTA